MMYKYTPNQKIKRDMLRAIKLGYDRKSNCTFEWAYIRSLGIVEYPQYVAFHKHFLDTVFYSSVEQKTIPVNGYLFDVSLFDVTVIG